MNLVGDTFLSVGFFAMLFLFGNLDYATVLSIAPYTNEYALTITGLPRMATCSLIPTTPIYITAPEKGRQMSNQRLSVLVHLMIAKRRLRT